MTPDSNTFAPPCDGWRTYSPSLPIRRSAYSAFRPMASVRSGRNRMSKEARNSPQTDTSRLVGLRMERICPGLWGCTGTLFHIKKCGKVGCSTRQNILALYSSCGVSSRLDASPLMGNVPSRNWVSLVMGTPENRQPHGPGASASRNRRGCILKQAKYCRKLARRIATASRRSQDSWRS